MIYMNISGGLTSRLYVLGSIVTSDRYPNEILPIWEPSEGINCRFNDIFKTEIEFADYDINKTYTQWLPGHHIDYNVKDGYYWSDYGIKIDDKLEMRDIYAWIKKLECHDEIQHLIDQYAAPLKQKHTEGIQIRRGIGKNYNVNACIYCDCLFIEGYVKRLIDEHNLQLFVATDSYYDLERLCILFRDNLVFVREFEKYPIDGGYTLAGLKRAWAEWILLSKCSQLHLTVNGGFGQRVKEVFNLPASVMKNPSPKLKQYFKTMLTQKQQGLF